MRFSVKVIPGAKRTRIVGWLGAALKVQVAAAPERGKANDELIDFLCRALSLPRNAVAVISGHTSQRKVIELADVTREQVDALVTAKSQPE
jgi:uncharacterized protein (TIGR00251 family)